MLEQLTTKHRRPRTPANGKRDLPKPWPWAILAVLVVAQLMVILDISIVNVALPSIDRSLHFGPGELQWIITAYTICSGGLVLVGGRTSDLFGRRRVFFSGLLLFTAASLASGLAPSTGALIASRAVQGVGAALLTPSALSIITVTYTNERRSTALAVWGAAAGAGIALGVVFGGMLTTWLNWHWIFLVNVPVGLAAAIVAQRIIPPMPATTVPRSLDLPGAALAVAAAASLVYGLSAVPNHGWGSPSAIGPLALAVALLAAFAWTERSATDPLLPASLIRRCGVRSSAGIMLAATGLLAGTFFLNSLYLQSRLNWSPIQTGVAFLPFVAAAMLGLHATSHLVLHFGTRTMILIGMLLTAAGASIFAIAPHHASYLTELLPGFILAGVGVGMTFPSVQIAAMNDIPGDSAGVAAGVLTTAHEIGAALGVALLSAAAAAPASPIRHYSAAFTLAAIIAAGICIVAAISAPAVRPSPGTRLSVH